MTIQRMEHVAIVVDDLAAATAFFVELGFKVRRDAAPRRQLIGSATSAAREGIVVELAEQIG